MKKFCGVNAADWIMFLGRGYPELRKLQSHIFVMKYNSPHIGIVHEHLTHGDDGGDGDGDAMIKSQITS